MHRSDPTENDSVEGLRPNARGPGLVTFGVSVVSFLSYFLAFGLPNHFWCGEFVVFDKFDCETNKIQEYMFTGIRD